MTMKIIVENDDLNRRASVKEVDLLSTGERIPVREHIVDPKGKIEIYIYDKRELIISEK